MIQFPYIFLKNVLISFKTFKQCCLLVTLFSHDQHVYFCDYVCPLVELWSFALPFDFCRALVLTITKKRKNGTFNREDIQHPSQFDFQINIRCCGDSWQQINTKWLVGLKTFLQCVTFVMLGKKCLANPHQAENLPCQYLFYILICFFPYTNRLCCKVPLLPSWISVYLGINTRLRTDWTLCSWGEVPRCLRVMTILALWSNPLANGISECL